MCARMPRTEKRRRFIVIALSRAKARRAFPVWLTEYSLMPDHFARKRNGFVNGEKNRPSSCPFRAEPSADLRADPRSIVSIYAVEIPSRLSPPDDDGSSVLLERKSVEIFSSCRSCCYSPAIFGLLSFSYVDKYDTPRRARARG